MQVTLIDKINRIYLTSTDKDKLLSAYNEICTCYLNNPSVKGFLKHKPELQSEYGIHEALSMRVLAKHLLIKYLEKYSEEDKDACLGRIKEMISVSADKNYLKTTKLLANVRDFVSDVHEIMKVAVIAVNRVRDDFGNLATDNAALIRESAQAIEKALKEAKSLESALLFPENVAVPDFIGGIIKDLEEEAEWFSGALRSSFDVRAAQLLEEFSSPLSSLGVNTSPRFYESPLDLSKTYAKAIVISTPFEEEAILFAGVYSSMTAKAFHLFHADKLSGDERRVPMEALFEAAACKDMSLLILGIERLDEAVVCEMEKAILEATKRNVHFLIHDNTGTRALYESFDKIASESETLSPRDVHHVFLSMPNFNQTCKILADNAFITDTEADKEKVRNSIPFIGYVGLNAILSSSPTADWLTGASELSRERANAAISYLNRLIASRQFIDDGWGNFSGHVRYVKGEKKSFDYDELRGIDKENIKAIMEKPGLTTFDRCGIITKYCLLSGNDSSVWKDLSASEKELRVTTATRMVCKILSTAYTPEVKILPDEGWDKKSAGGYCEDGGKRIVYRESSVSNYTWVEDAVCHECYHAFQHTALYMPYADWFFTELGVTEGRINSWDDNFKVYVGTEEPKTYRVEVVECDARAFALDCLRNIEKYWKDIDFN